MLDFHSGLLLPGGFCQRQRQSDGRRKTWRALAGRNSPGGHWPWVKIQILPVNIPIQPLKLALKGVVNSPGPKWDPIGFDPQPPAFKEPPGKPLIGVHQTRNTHSHVRIVQDCIFWGMASSTGQMFFGHEQLAACAWLLWWWTHFWTWKGWPKFVETWMTGSSLRLIQLQRKPQQAAPHPT